VLARLIELAGEHGLDLIGEPSLVRLNPNVPWRTRGNAALAARFGRGRGPRRRLGGIGPRATWGFRRGVAADRPREEHFLAAAWELVRREARVGDAGTDPALVATRAPLPVSLYRRAVAEIVPVADIYPALRAAGAEWWTGDDDRGLVGASAALAWPGRRATWEVIAYRNAERIGSPRRVSADSVRRAARRHPDLFLCDDPRTRRLLVAPHTDCPILYGLRGTTSAAPLAARREVVAEAVERWLLFRTNQGTGDHLLPRTGTDWPARTGGVLRGSVVEPPRATRGGHVRLIVEDSDRVPVECFAFEPTKTLPRVTAALVPGDRVRIWGSRGGDATVRLEGLEVLEWARTRPGLRPPRCVRCDRPTASLGRQRGYRCPGCRRRWPPEAARPTGRGGGPPIGTYHPTPSARRHLAPLGDEFRGRREGGRPAARG
jgi:tRNA(Ile2)-agmatinylcytidine synthase